MLVESESTLICQNFVENLSSRYEKRRVQTQKRGLNGRRYLKIHSQQDRTHDIISCLRRKKGGGRKAEKAVD